MLICIFLDLLEDGRSSHANENYDDWEFLAVMLEGDQLAYCKNSGVKSTWLSEHLVQANKFSETLVKNTKMDSIERIARLSFKMMNRYEDSIKHLDSAATTAIVQVMYAQQPHKSENLTKKKVSRDKRSMH